MHGQGCWEGEDFPSKALLQECAERRGGRVATNLHVRDMDLGIPNAADSRRLEVVVDGLPLHGGVQLAIDTTLVSAVKGDGSPQRGAADRDGVALANARRRKMRTYRTGGSRCTCSIGRSCLGGGRQVVFGGKQLCEAPGQSESKV